ncbi:MAG: membrane protein insertase YidC [Clostridia bacterium]|nr:membrane protein insertase YidC [Clostridia bacterium]
MDLMILATELNGIGKLIYNGLYQWVQSWGNDYALMGAFGITVILFTLFLKLATLPFDVWQKVLTRKNALKMEVMKPELDKITKQCGQNRELLMQKQRELYKKHKYSAFSACLPSLLTLAIFFMVFSGFNSAVRHYNSAVFDDLSNVYETAYTAAIAEKTDEISDEAALETYAIGEAEQAVLASYNPERFLLTKNIFMPDNWKSPIPDIQTYSGTGMGKLGISDADRLEYQKIMSPIIQKYNFNEEGKKVWNGYLILPIISFALSILSTKLIKAPETPQMAGQTEEQMKAQQSQAKMMTYIMPFMMGIFALFYSTAFALYMVVSNLFTTAFNLGFNIVSKQIDKKRKDEIMSRTIKK